MTGQVSSVHCQRRSANTAAIGSSPQCRISPENLPASSASPSGRTEEFETATGRRLTLALVGHDRVGIVREVSQVLAHHAVNVEELNTHTASAPMSAEILFHATAELTASTSLDTAALVHELEQISIDLMVDITLDESIRR